MDILYIFIGHGLGLCIFGLIMLCKIKIKDYREKQASIKYYAKLETLTEEQKRELSWIKSNTEYYIIKPNL